MIPYSRQEITEDDILDLQEQHKALDNIAEPTDSERANQESLRTEHNNSVERFKAVDLPVSLTLIISGAVLGIASLVP